MLRISLALLLAGLVTAAATAADESPDRARRRTPIVAVFEQTRDAVVNINTTRIVRSRSLTFGTPLDDIFDFDPRPRRDREVHSVGSGAIVHPAGYIVTNAHVVAQASDVSVTFADQSTLPAEIIAVAPRDDLAVLRVRAPGPLPTCRLGASGDILIGETVVAIGNPLGLEHTVTTGIVSAINRELRFGDVTYQGLIQTDAPINPGNSGGPLLNINAELIGINTAIRGDAQNIGFAIPISRLVDLLPSMLDLERRQRVRVGLAVDARTPRVTAVRPETPAAAAELRPGDVLERFNGTALASGIDYYVQLLEASPEEDVRLVVRRGDERRDVTLKIEALPPPDGAALARTLLGVELQEITPALRRRYRLPDYARLIVDNVQRGSPADAVGMQRGDLILRLDQTPTLSLNDVGLVLERIRPGADVAVDGVRLEPFFSWTVPIRTRAGD
jgi:serine protease Do